MHLNIAYDLLPKTQTVHTSMVMNHFGIGFETGRHVIAENLELPLRAGDVVCFTGESGSGKSSLMQGAAAQLEGIVFADSLDLGEACLVDGLGVPFADAMRWLSLCGLSEAQLTLRTPAELSDGQRYRYRLALALAQRPQWIVADEFTASLDRTLAKLIAFNLGKVARQENIGLLLATTHADILGDLSPDLHVACELGGQIDCTRHECKKKRFSLADEFEITTGTKQDWTYFARWHYRSHRLGFVRFVTLLWHQEKPVGICVFTSAPRVLSQRNRFFGIRSQPRSLTMKALDRQLWMLSRVVMHPSYRGAGLAADFVRRSCQLAPRLWIETQTQMGWINPFFEKAGFVRVGHATARMIDRRAHSAIYGGGSRRHGRQKLVSEETYQKSRFAEPIYYIFDNRRHHGFGENSGEEEV